MSSDLPVDGDGACMKCKAAPPALETVLCRTCATPWHMPCLTAPPDTLAKVLDWLCPDCSAPAGGEVPAAAEGAAGASGDLVSKIRTIEADATLDEKEKARRRQALVSGKAHDSEEEVAEAKRREKGKMKKADGDVLGLLDESFKCSFCRELPERPVTTPCGHNFCLKCFERWVSQGNRHCTNCRTQIPIKIAKQPRINSALVAAIRMAKPAKSATAETGKVYHFMHNESKPEKAFTTERAKKAGKANASSGRIFVTVPDDHFGSIPTENDPERNRGLLVGESFEDRFESRQWGAHFPLVAGIAGQSNHGAQSVVLSGGYLDDEDHGEWFLYTGSGGRDLSGNKRTNKDQSFDQKFEKFNRALQLSCLNGYPVRVVRSFKEKRSSYAPDKGLRYDGVYRIEKCWRKQGIQGFKVCRYLFVRCDNEPAPWTSDEQGDRPRRLPLIKELKDAIDVTERKDSPSWDYDEGKGWIWMKPPPLSRKKVRSGDPSELKKRRKSRKLARNISVMEQLLNEFSCSICRQVMTSPVSTPCGHNFCQSCLLEFYANKSFVRERSAGGRSLRAQKIVKKCPSCQTDISDYLQNPEVNRELMGLIESLKQKSEEEKEVISEEGVDEDDEDDLSEDADAGADDEEVQEDSGAEVVNGTEVKNNCLDDKIEYSTEEMMDKGPKRGRPASDVSPPPQKRVKGAGEETEDTVSVGAADSPSSPLADVSSEGDAVE